MQGPSLLSGDTTAISRFGKAWMPGFRDWGSGSRFSRMLGEPTSSSPKDSTNSGGFHEHLAGGCPASSIERSQYEGADSTLGYRPPDHSLLSSQGAASG